MKAQTTRSFWKRYWALQAYALWRNNPSHPSLFFKRVKDDQPLHSVRIGLGYRALGLLKGDTVSWFWIGDHDEYDQLIK
ncbi:hypothetical protein FBQ81_08115 [Chloroflexi bacterium CFX6]|nr:hypothetical protein [Chloroflexi bacterium CFX6]